MTLYTIHSTDSAYVLYGDYVPCNKHIQKTQNIDYIWSKSIKYLYR